MPDKSTILKDLKNHLQIQLNSSVTDLILFGSQVNGQSTEFSDFDISCN